MLGGLANPCVPFTSCGWQPVLTDPRDYTPLVCLLNKTTTPARDKTAPSPTLPHSWLLARRTTQRCQRYKGAVWPDSNAVSWQIQLKHAIASGTMHAFTRTKHVRQTRGVCPPAACDVRVEPGGADILPPEARRRSVRRDGSLSQPAIVKRPHT